MVRRGIAHVPEGRGVVTELTVEENLRLGGLWRKDKADARGPPTRSTSCSSRWPGGAEPRAPALRR